MPDYEDLILKRQEEREILEDECSGECEHCPYGLIETDFRIDREPEYICTLFN